MRVRHLTIITLRVEADEAVEEHGALMRELRDLLSDYACDAEVSIDKVETLPGSSQKVR